MAYVKKHNRWEDHLKHVIVLPYEDWGQIVTEGLGDPYVRPRVDNWLEENIGYTNQSLWHKDKFHPFKPKWHYEFSNSSGRFCSKLYLTFRFFEQEDALAFKLAWM